MAANIIIDKYEYWNYEVVKRIKFTACIGLLIGGGIFEVWHVHTNYRDRCLILLVKQI